STPFPPVRIAFPRSALRLVAVPVASPAPAAAAITAARRGLLQRLVTAVGKQAEHDCDVYAAPESEKRHQGIACLGQERVDCDECSNTDGDLQGSPQPLFR